MNEEDDAFEDLAKRQGDWGMQGSRKHQIMRYAENVESKGTSMTQDEIIEMAQECKLIGMRPFIDGIYTEALIEFAKLVAAKEREACANMVDHILKENGGTYGDAIRIRGQA
jgi:hypothetical protein